MNIKAYYLIEETGSVKDVDEYGEVIKTTKERKVYPNVSSTRQSEFYQAQANGLNLEKTVSIREFEYKQEKKIRENDTIYEIVRTFSTGDGNIELVLKRGVNQGVSSKVSNNSE